MADFSRFLPLSQRSPSDESNVVSDRRLALAAVIDQAAALLATTTAPDGAARVETLVRAARLDADLDAVPAGDPVARLRALAGIVRDGRRRSIRALARGCRALLALARDLRVPVDLDPLTAGAVALWASGAAPLDRRAVVKGRTVRAADAAWEFGRGPVLEGTATAIAAFLLGVSDHPPQPVTPPR